MSQMEFRTTKNATAVMALIPICCCIGFVYALYCYFFVSKVQIDPRSKMKKMQQLSPNSRSLDVELTKNNETQLDSNFADDNGEYIDDNESDSDDNIASSHAPTKGKDIEQGMKISLVDDTDVQIFAIYNLIRDGSQAFLMAEYRYLLVYIFVFGLTIGLIIGCTVSAMHGMMASIAFVLGSGTSITAGYIGMKVATYSNARTCVRARSSLGEAFHVAFLGGSVMGFSLTSLGLLVLYLVFIIFSSVWFKHMLPEDTNEAKFNELLQDVMRSLAGFGIGASSVALFARVGGGIYTKAADVGADLVGKLENSIPEDDIRNPATIADNVGDNVGDIAGMGADLFGSFAGSMCASFVLAAQLKSTAIFDEKLKEIQLMPIAFGLSVSAAGILGCFISAVLFNAFMKVHTKLDVKKFLSYHELLSTVISCAFVWLFAWMTFGSHKYIFNTTMIERQIYWYKIAGCVTTGLFGGWIIGYITEYYTSTEHSPVREVAESTRTGAATNIIYGLALGYLSTCGPVIILAFSVWFSMHLAGMYGVSLATVGVLCTLCTSLSVDAFGPIADNAGGIAEMANLGSEVRERTDALDATGNTTAAIGKGFAIASAGLVGVALMGAFQFTVSPTHYYPIIDELAFAGLLIGAMLPYVFSALTMKAVGKAALAMVEEVRRQFRENPGILDGTVKPDYDRCIQISTESSLRQMIAPGLLVILTPLVFGFMFGTKIVVGILAGSLVSGVQCAISASNTGGAWDNAKKYIEAGLLAGCDGKGSAEHKAAVIGDTVGDPLKDTSGPALNILIKLMGIISVVFAKAMMESQKDITNINFHAGVFSKI